MAERDIRLQEAARALGVTPRNLGRLLDVVGIETSPDPRDKRRQLLTGAQLQQLLERFPPAPATAADVDERVQLLTQQLGALQAQILSLTTWLTAQADTIGSLTTRVQDLEQQQVEIGAKVTEFGKSPVMAGSYQYTGSTDTSRIAALTAGVRAMAPRATASAKTKAAKMKGPSERAGRSKRKP